MREKILRGILILAFSPREKEWPLCGSGFRMPLRQIQSREFHETENGQAASGGKRLAPVNPRFSF